MLDCLPPRCRIAHRPGEQTKIDIGIPLLAPRILGHAVQGRNPCLGQVLGAIVVTQAIVELADGIQQLRPQFRLGRKTRRQHLTARIKQLARRQFLRLLDVDGTWQIGTKQIDHERLDGVGLGRLLLRKLSKPLRLVSLLDRLARLPDDAGDTQDYGRDQAGAGSDSHPVSANELPQPIAQAVRTRKNRPVIQVGLQIVHQGAHRDIAFAGRLAQGLGNNIFQIAGQDPLEAVTNAAAASRHLVRRHAEASLRQRPGLGVDDLARQPGRTDRPLTVGPPPRQQPVENHGQRVDIGGRGDGAAFDLFRSSILRRQPGTGNVGQRRLFADRGIALDQLGDTEIEQFDAAVPLDQDIRRLEIPVHDQVGMSVRHCRTDL